MRCPNPDCTALDTNVVDSRPAEEGGAVRRRRECKACGRRFTTFERIERAERLMVIKRDGSRVAFDGERVLAGIQRACSKRPIEAATMERIATQVEDELHRRFTREVDSAEIGRSVAVRLREVDPVAYIRYASVYYAFRSVEDFATEITALQERPPVGDHPTLFGEGKPKS